MAASVKHTLKTWPVYFDAVARGEKTFEVRRNDRGFQTGDIVELKRWVPAGQGLHQYSDAYDDRVAPLQFRIGWILQGGQFGIEPGICVFSLSPMETRHD